MANSYVFILGRNPALSVAEIISVLKRDNISPQNIHSSDEVLLLDLEKPIDHKRYILSLGGTIKIGQIYKAFELNNAEIEFKEFINGQNLLQYFFTRKTGKIHFGLSLYYLEKTDAVISERKFLQSLGKNIKKSLKEMSLSSGFVQIKERYLSSVSVLKNGLLDTGNAEILILVSQNHLYIGKTISVQAFAAYSGRDFGRPERDTRSGMLPPKLAQILLNLSQTTITDTILDPFCGSGTIITEAALMGYQHIIGTDIKKEVVESSRQNWAWTKKYYLNPEIAQKINVNIFTCNVASISAHIPSRSIDAIITEPYLGPPTVRIRTDYEIAGIVSELEKLYYSAFVQFSKIIKRGGRTVFIFPAFRTKQGIKYINSLDPIEQLGFQMIPVLPEEIRDQYPLYSTPRRTIIYGRGDEFVMREILVFDYN